MLRFLSIYFPKTTELHDGMKILHLVYLPGTLPATKWDPFLLALAAYFSNLNTFDLYNVFQLEIGLLSPVGLAAHYSFVFGLVKPGSFVQPLLITALRFVHFTVNVFR